MVFYMVETEGHCKYWWIFEISIFYFAENYSQQDFKCSFLQQMVQFTAPSGNLPLSERIWNSGWCMIPFKMNLWGELPTCVYLCVGHADLRWLQDILWQTDSIDAYKEASSNAFMWKMVCVNHYVWMRGPEYIPLH